MKKKKGGVKERSKNIYKHLRNKFIKDLNSHINNKTKVIDKIHIILRDFEESTYVMISSYDWVSGKMSPLSISIQYLEKFLISEIKQEKSAWETKVLKCFSVNKL